MRTLEIGGEESGVLATVGKHEELPALSGSMNRTGLPRGGQLLVDIRGDDGDRSLGATQEAIDDLAVRSPGARRAPSKYIGPGHRPRQRETNGDRRIGATTVKPGVGAERATTWAQKPFVELADVWARCGLVLVIQGINGLAEEISAYGGEKRHRLKSDLPVRHNLRSDQVLASTTAAGAELEHPGLDAGLETGRTAVVSGKQE